MFARKDREKASKYGSPKRRQAFTAPSAPCIAPVMSPSPYHTRCAREQRDARELVARPVRRIECLLAELVGSVEQAVKQGRSRGGGEHERVQLDRLDARQLKHGFSVAENHAGEQPDDGRRRAQEPRGTNRVVGRDRPRHCRADVLQC